MKIKVPFKFGFILFEKELSFSFCFASLEYATKKILNCKLYEIGTKTPMQINIAILYAAYIQGCRERYRKPVYTLTHAEFWFRHMSEASMTKFVEACNDLMGELKETSEQKKT